MKKVVILSLAATLVGLSACKEKKQSDDIIAPRVEAPKPQAPISMQPYSDTKSVQWMGNTYKVSVNRSPLDSVMVSDAIGQRYVDNRIRLRVERQDGTVFFERLFTKSAFAACLDADYLRSGVLEALVLVDAKDHELRFAASVCKPQSDDEFIPMVLTLSNQGAVTISRDNDKDTFGGDEATDGGDDDGV